MTSSLAWINLIRLIDSIERRWGYAKLDWISKRVLEWVVTSSNAGSPIYVQTVINECGVASPASLHKSMVVLRREGLLEFKTDPLDSRRKIVSVTRKANKLLEQLSDDVTKNVKNISRQQ